MTFLEAQRQARQAFAITSAPGLDTVAKVLQFAVTTEQDRLAAEIAKVEGQNNDLQRALAAERERGERKQSLITDLEIGMQHYMKLMLSESVRADTNERLFVTANSRKRQAQADLAAERERGDRLAAALRELREAIKSVPYANEYEPAYTATLNADAALAAHRQARP